jgi:exopolysaccharide production protein ExoZ
MAYATAGYAMPGSMRGRNAMPRSIILSVQYLRGIAAMAVALAHIAGHAGLPGRTGAAGVDVFFVISGFIIWTVTAERRRTPGAFMLDRLTRIAPPYVALTFATYLVAVCLPGAFPHMRTSLRHAILSALFVPHQDLYGTAFPQVIPGWTLNYEIFFYLIFALCLKLAPRPRILTATAVLTGLATSGMLIGSRFAAMDVYTNTLLLEFAAGLWLGYARQRRVLPPYAWGFAALLLGLTMLAAWQALDGSDPTGWRVLAWGVPAVLIVGGAVTIERRQGFARSETLLLLGSASFSIYLVNVFVVAAAWRLLGAWSVPAYCLAALLCSTAAGILCWRFVELPLTRRARHWLHRPPSLAVPMEMGSPLRP